MEDLHHMCFLCADVVAKKRVGSKRPSRHNPDENSGSAPKAAKEGPFASPSKRRRLGFQTCARRNRRIRLGVALFSPESGKSKHKQQLTSVSGQFATDWPSQTSIKFCTSCVCRSPWPGKPRYGSIFLVVATHNTCQESYIFFRQFTQQVRIGLPKNA